MKRPAKLLLAVLAAGSVTGLAFFGWSVKAKDDATKARDAATFHFANGVQVTPAEVKSDDMAQLLDIKIWKFDVLVPDPNKTYYYSLDFCQHGKVAKQVCSFGVGPVKGVSGKSQLHLMVGMVPLDDTFSKAKRIKYNIQVNGVVDGFADGVNVPGVFDNPFQRDKSSASEVQVSEPDNLIYLISGDKAADGAYGNAVANDHSLALEIETAYPKH